MAERASLGCASLGCASCGACCDPVYLTPESAAKLRDTGPRADTSTIAFAREHWHPRAESPLPGHIALDCDQFDAATRTCTAYDTRPPACSKYPWYGDGPTRERSIDLPPQCSYLLDVAPEHRPQGSRPLIPIEVVRRA